MDPFTLALCIAVAYVAVGGDNKTLRASRGVVGMARAAGSGASGHVRAERARTAPARAQARQARQAKLAESGPVGRARLRAGKYGAKAGHGIAGAARAGAAAAKAAPSGYAPAAERATQRRAERKAARGAKKAQRKEARAAARARREERFRMADSIPIPNHLDPTKAPQPQEDTHMEAPAAPTSDLQNIGELRIEVVHQMATIEGILEGLLPAIKNWSTSLTDRVTPAPFGTPAIAATVAALADTAPQCRDLLATQELLGSLLKAIDDTAPVAEAASATSATGNVQAYASV